jgi:hypothetical protein
VQKREKERCLFFFVKVEKKEKKTLKLRERQTTHAIFSSSPPSSSHTRTNEMRERKTVFQHRYKRNEKIRSEGQKAKGREKPRAAALVVCFFPPLPPSSLLSPLFPSKRAPPQGGDASFSAREANRRQMTTQAARQIKQIRNRKNKTT